MWASSQIAIVPGAKVDPNAAAQIMGAIEKFSPSVSEAKKQLCRPTAKTKRPE
jgi:hypothetical protein